MSIEIKCSSCKHVLHIPANAIVHPRTCPRCLSRLQPATQPVLGVSSAGGEAGGVEVEPQCPRCGKPVERPWRVCPFCEEPLRGLETSKRLPVADDDVKKDGTGTIIGLIILAVMTLCGIIYFFALGGPDLFAGSSGSATVWMVGLVVVGVMVAGTVLIVMNVRGTSGKVASAFLGSMAIASTMVLIFVLAIVVAIFSAFVSIMETCSKCK